MRCFGSRTGKARPPIYARCARCALRLLGFGSRTGKARPPIYARCARCALRLLGFGSRTLVVVAYFILFWLVLPSALYVTAHDLNVRYSWTLAPSPVVGILTFSSGALFLLWSIVELWRRGRGLPVSALPPPKLTVRGPYRFVRHPIYFSFNVALLGAGLGLGDVALTVVISPAFLLLWMIYAAIEERGLRRRFGAAYRRYADKVKMLPRINLYRLGQWAMVLGLFPVRVVGTKVPKKGGVVLVVNHACYIDPFLVSRVTSRQIRFIATGEAYRKRFMRWLMYRLGAVPLRRYRPDPSAYRQMLGLLADGEVVGIFPEGERSVHGGRLPVLASTARALRRVDLPVIPVGLNRNFNAGPRWSEKIRRSEVVVRIGDPIVWTDDDPGEQLSRALDDLIDTPPIMILKGLDRSRLRRVLWRCPACLNEEQWRTADLFCSACDTRFEPTAEGRFRVGDEEKLLVDLAKAVWSAPEEGPLLAEGRAQLEPDSSKKLAPLETVQAAGQLEVSKGGISMGEVNLPIEAIHSVTTERADTLQVGVAGAMWQFKLAKGSAFRLREALARWIA